MEKVKRQDAQDKEGYTGFYKIIGSGVMMGFLYEEITAKILEACFEVSNELGAGFLESVYQRALLIALEQKGLKAQAETHLSVHFRNQVVGHYLADLLVEDRIIVELKAVHSLTPEHQAQVINYLQATGLEVALLVNFGTPRIQYKRLERQKRTSTTPS